MSQSYIELASDQVIATTKKNLEAHGFAVEVVADLAEAKEKVLRMLPEGSEVYTVTSRTLDQAGISAVINEAGAHQAVKPKILDLSYNQNDHDTARRIGAGPSFVVGSVHGITQEGEVVVASATGSQLAPYVYGAEKVIWVASTKKIVKDLSEAFARIRDHIFPLEDERAKEAYGIPSSINKELIFHQEAPGRITLILVKEDAGF